MRIFAGVPRGGDVNCQTTINVHASVREFEHERTFITYLLLRVVWYKSRQFETELANVGMNTQCNMYYRCKIITTIRTFIT